MKDMSFELSIPPLEDLLPAVAGQLGYASVHEAGQDILEEMKRQIRIGREAVRPGQRFKMCSLDQWNGEVLRGGDLCIKSAQWSRLMQRLVDPRFLCCFVVTLGAKLDETIARTQKQSMLQAYLLDAVGAVLAEKMADQMERHLSTILAGKGVEATARFSPGYCDWEVGEGQKQLFAFLEPEKVGITCTTSGMMIPLKTVSACLVGARKVPLRTPCDSCSLLDCAYRREGMHPPPGDRKMQC